MISQETIDDFCDSEHRLISKVLAVGLSPSEDPYYPEVCEHFLQTASHYKTVVDAIIYDIPNPDLLKEVSVIYCSLDKLRDSEDKESLMNYLITEIGLLRLYIERRTSLRPKDSYDILSEIRDLKSAARF